MSYKAANDVILEQLAVTSDIESEAVELLHMFGYSMQIEWTATTGIGTGTVSLQASNDEQTWVPLASPTQAIVIDNGSVMFNVPDVYYKFVRVAVDHTDGTIDSIKATYNGKGA